MKIIFVHKDINDVEPAGGINTVYLEYIKRLSAISGMEIAVITEREGKWNLRAKRFITKEKDPVNRQKEITKIINQYNPDIVDCFSWGAEILDYVNNQGRAKTVMRADIPMHYYKIFPCLDEELAQKADVVAAISKWCLGEWLPLTNKKVILIPHAGKDIVKSQVKKNTNSVLWVGKQTDMKGFDRLFCLGDTFYSEYHLTCVIARTRFTDDEKINKLRNKHVTVYESLSREEYDAISGSSQFILSTARKEGFCIAILEAMQTGAIPIVPFFIGGALDFVNYKNGVIYSHESEIYNKLKSIKDMKKKAALSIKEANKFSWEDIVKKNLDLYKELLK
jgi:glycosyltransferase involved in cell wall biosynthesis